MSDNDGRDFPLHPTPVERAANALRFRIAWESIPDDDDGLHSPRLTGRTIIEAALRDPQPTLAEENLLRFMREDMAHYGIPPFDPAEFDRQVQAMSAAARRTFGEHWVEERIAEFEARWTGKTLPECQSDFLADFAGDPEQGPSLRRLYPDMAFDCFDPADYPHVRRSLPQARNWRGPRNRRRWRR